MSDRDRTVGPAELAEALDVSERHIYRLARLGMPKAGRGEYPLVRCAAWYRTHVLSGSNGDETPDLGEARLRKARTRAVEAERELARRKEDVVPAEVWDETVSETDRWIRETVVDFAAEWAEALEGLEEPREIQPVLQDRVREGLEELRQGPPGRDVKPEQEDDRERAA